MMTREIPVYLFTGFLESGKTTFIQETLEDERFNSGERTLLLLCEEGIEEYDPSLFSGENVFIVPVESKEQLTGDFLREQVKKYDAERAVIEYNGMWMLQDLFDAMPSSWVIYQEFSFANAETFLSYNANMRQLTYDKLKTCDVIVFNRYSDDIDMMELHKIVRAASRRAQIAYEYPGGLTKTDDIEDPLPFDIDADVIQINDEDFAYWYRDLAEDMDKYQDRVVRFKGITADSSRLPKDIFAVGRALMTCCVEDIQMTGLICERPGRKPEPKQWLWVTAKIDIKKSPGYGNQSGPVLLVKKIEPAEPPEQEVASFF